MRLGRKVLIVALCCVLIALTFPGVPLEHVQAEASQATTIPVTNTGFEDAVIDGVIPGWTQIFSPAKAGTVSVDSTQYKTDNYSLKIYDNDSANFGVESDKIPVVVGNEYTVSAAVYIGVSVQLQLRFYNETSSSAISTITHNPDFQAAPKNTWETISIGAVAPEGATKLSVVLATAKNGKGTSFWDDIHVTSALLEEVPERNPEPIPPVYNIANASFEANVVDGIIPNWTIKSGTPTVSLEHSLAGSGSLKAHLTKDQGQSAINIESNLIDVEENTTYLLSAQVYLEVGSVQGLYVYVYDKDGNIVKSAEGNNHHTYKAITTGHEAWNYHEQAFTVQPGGVKLKVSLITGAKNSFKFYIDEVSVMKQITNGDMESPANGGVIPGWNKTNPNDADSFEISTTRKNNGESSLHLKNTPGKYLNVISDLLPVEAGATYTAIAHTWIENGSADMYVRYYDANSTYMGKQNWNITSSPNDVWFDQYVTAVVPDGAQYAAILFAGSNSKSYSYFVDDIKMIRGDHAVPEVLLPDNSITLVGQDLGPQIRKATLMRGAIGLDHNDRQVIYTVVAGAPSIFTIIDIETEQVLKSLPLPETSGAWSVTTSSDGSVYMGAYNLGLLYRYIPSADQLVNLGHPFTTKDSVLYPMAAGKDGIMYGSTYPTANLYAYNPDTNAFTDYGTMSTKTSGERWTRVTVYDEESHKIYAGVGNVPRLLEYDLATGAKRDLLPDGFDNIVSVYDLNIADGRLFARKEANNANETFVIDIGSGDLIEVTNADTGVKSTTFTNFSRGVSPVSPIANKLYFAATGGELYEYDLDTNSYRTTGASIEGAAIAYEFIQLNEADFPGYSLVGLSGNSGKMFKYNLETGAMKLTDVQLPAEPVNIHEITKGPDGKIYSAGYLQGNLGVHTPSTGESMYYEGVAQGEGMIAIHNKLYLGIYPGASIYEYDLSKPWNRTNSNELNPNKLFQLGDINQDRPFGMAGAEDLNKLFIGTVPKNGMLGGALTVYDIETGGVPEIYANLIPDQSILSLAYKDGLLYGGTSIHGGQGGTPTATEAKLFIWDVVNKKKIFEVVPVAGKQAITAIHIGPDGNIWGLANGALFIFDIETQKVIYSNNAFPNSIGRWIDGSMETGTDGNVYATVAGNFFKIDAVTKEITVLASGVRKLTQDDYGNFYMFTDPETPNLYKHSIPELLLKLVGVESSVATSQLRVGDQTSLSLKGLLEGDRTTHDLDGAIKVYSSSATSVAEVDSNGIITATQLGRTQISVMVTLDGVTVTSVPIEVNVTHTTDITPEPEEPNHPQGPGTSVIPAVPTPVTRVMPDESTTPAKPGSSKVTFSDIARHPAQSQITKAVEHGYINGYEDGSFRPDNKVTRAEFAVMLGRALNLEVRAEGKAFADDDSIPAWAKPFVLSLSQQSLVNGYEDNTFRPTRQMTRVEVIVMLVRGLKLSINPDVNLSFEDATDIPVWAQPSLAAALNAGLIDAGEENLFDPKHIVTRAELVTLMNRMLDFLEKQNNVTK
ncbi:S-layer homology domain-containing protein [Paenibacillus sp. FA6]|uniref:S-layer homology domain-containing protein n=1 Tax=Paenibacillus sp. FA6 TaxID=3413029 RepID=UPI003F657411